ncbi:MAG: peptide chain release factor 1 [Cytophagaceae bacterium SCN 52-12]|nr:MAG: peptide chain release factor 1 [Cytophagaceae bacterium SCN 52-12]
MSDPAQLLPELTFHTSRSGGKGGQNVNKVESKVELRFDIQGSGILSEEEKSRLQEKLHNRVSQEGILILYHQTERSQLANKELVTEKFCRLVRGALAKEAPRKATRPTLASILEKRQSKTKRSALKASRRKPGFD